MKFVPIAADDHDLVCFSYDEQLTPLINTLSARAIKAYTQRLPVQPVCEESIEISGYCWCWSSRRLVR